MKTREALDLAGKARRKAVSAARQLETAFEEIDDRGAAGATRTVSGAARQLREAAELLEEWEDTYA